MWDNFNKTDDSHSVRYGDSNTHSIKFINRAALALPPPKCLNVRERVEVVEWKKMVPSLPLLSCELSVSVKENPDRKKKKICLNKTCQSQCQNSCYWEKERIPSETNFDEIYLNNHGTNVKNKFTECRSRFILRETSNVFALLSKLSDEHNTRESILAQSSPSNESTIDVGTFL